MMAMNPSHRLGSSLSRAALSLAVALALTGCGDLTAGGVGEGRATVVGDSPPSGSSPALSSPTSHEGGDPEASAPPFSPSGNGRIEGDLRVRVEIFLRHQNGDLVELTSGPALLTLQADGTTTESLDLTEIPTGTYQGVRLLFQQIELDVRSGLPFGGLVTVDLGTQNFVEVNRDIPFLVDTSTRVNVLINLRTSAWANAAAPALPVVAAAQFRNAVQIEVTNE